MGMPTEPLGDMEGRLFQEDGTAERRPQSRGPGDSVAISAPLRDMVRPRAGAEAGHWCPGDTDSGHLVGFRDGFCSPRASCTPPGSPLSRQRPGSDSRLGSVCTT